MPTLEHNALVEMFRENPDLAPHLLKTLFHIDLPPHASVRVADTALDQLLPVEFRADLVLELRDEKGALLLAIVLEAQREKDPRKKYSWPVYAVVVRAQRECDTIVVVIAPDADVAAWAAEPIDLGLGRGTLQPFVIGPAVVPVVTDPAEAGRETELSVLSALAHGNGPSGRAVVEAALVALEQLDQEHAAVYFEVIYNALRKPMREALEALVMEQQTEGKVRFPPFAQKIFEMGLQEGEVKGELKGKIEGKIEGKQDVLLRLLARAGITLTEDHRARIQTCSDVATLDRWIDNVLGAKTADDVFA